MSLTNEQIYEGELNKARIENERLRAALAKIADDGKNCSDHCRRQAAKALSQPILPPAMTAEMHNTAK